MLFEGLKTVVAASVEDSSWHILLLAYKYSDALLQVWPIIIHSILSLVELIRL